MEGLCRWDLLIKLDTDIFEPLLTTWLELKDVGALDTAWCNRISRQKFLLSLSSIESPLTIAEYDKDDHCARWAAQRGAKVNLLKLNVSGGINSGFHHSKIDFCGFVGKQLELHDSLRHWLVSESRVEEIRLTDVSVDAVLLKLLLDCFPRLRTLRCFSLCKDCLPLIAASTCTLTSVHTTSRYAYLQSFSDAGCASKLTAVSVHYAAEQNTRYPTRALSLSAFPALVLLTLGYSGYEEFIAIIKSTPNLRHLQVDHMFPYYSGPKLCRAIAEALPQLQSLVTKCGFPQSQEGISPNAESTEQAVLDMVLNLRHLRELRLEQDPSWWSENDRYLHLSEHTRAYDITNAPPNTSVRTVVLGQILHFDFIGHLMQVCGYFTASCMLRYGRPYFIA
jgi:hypothetical protein